MVDFNNNIDVSNEGYNYILKYNLLDTYLLAKNKDSGVTIEGKIDGWDKIKRI